MHAERCQVQVKRMIAASTALARAGQFRQYLVHVQATTLITPVLASIAGNRPPVQVQLCVPECTACMLTDLHVSHHTHGCLDAWQLVHFSSVFLS